eukprot:CAMPEP_0185597580 /NCGR_PEP_ID=MMETSP0434-20130131/81453_1 /TAXON_ID=626734 ORGANISM="Favella taraikaensis, Strain Fe Narragansett Bay" /NCGR_SAMPLE_ID=MMETSP0434 /ASSEMBLY_ACC=CAM_ASM_000379 /LENGTH=64 /DNA_ID=CAMNT_0028226331 /DNA_START=844 /DNA_END=1038 /DNA_ORIENTATION=-
MKNPNIRMSFNQQMASQSTEVVNPNAKKGISGGNSLSHLCSPSDSQLSLAQKETKTENPITNRN